MSYKGKFTPKNPEKYKGNAQNIVYRSLWELKAMRYFDMNPNVILWASEELVIPYLSPIDNKMHRYFPDFLIQIRKKDNTVETYLLEVKPHKQTLFPVKTGKRKSKFLSESMTYAINQAKWKAADIFCQKQGWTFKLITEYELGIKKSNK